MKPTLLVLAAGMGSRYGGLKQIDPIGPSGETILDYSVYDALQAGFGKVVFIIRREMEADFREVFGEKLGRHIEVDWVFQETDMLPVGFKKPDYRIKPWGTGHAVLMARDVINEPFAMINADDFYGRASYEAIYGFLTGSSDPNEYAMVAYWLQNTLSEFGTVSRGVCQSTDDFLNTVKEFTRIGASEGGIFYENEQGEKLELQPSTLVSMNYWGFKPSFFHFLEREFTRFLETNIGNPKSEFYIPSVIDTVIRTGEAKVRVLQNSGSWFGITYKDDKPDVINKINKLIEAGYYPANLWNT